MFPEKVYYEENALNFELGKQLKEKYKHLEWVKIESHNNIPELRSKENSEFVKMKDYLIIATRKTHKYSDNFKVSDYLVPFTSSGCSAMCLYCYLVCNYNKCSYLRIFVNREEMLEKLLKKANSSEKELTFEIGSNSDLVLENQITGNLKWVIEEFAKNQKGNLTFPTKFDMIDDLLELDHQGRVIFRMSLNPQYVITHTEFRTSNLENRIKALNKMCDAGYKVGILLAPIVLVENYQKHYIELFETMQQLLSEKVKKEMFFEVIFMTYSYVHRAINNQAFPNAIELYDKALMTGRGRGKYCYRQEARFEAEEFIKIELEKMFKKTPILYIV